MRIRVYRVLQVYLVSVVTPVLKVRRVIQVCLVWSDLQVSKERRVTEVCQDLRDHTDPRVKRWVHLSTSSLDRFLIMSGCFNLLLCCVVGYVGCYRTYWSWRSSWCACEYCFNAKLVNHENINLIIVERHAVGHFDKLTWFFPQGPRGVKGAKGATVSNYFLFKLITQFNVNKVGRLYYDICCFNAECFSVV